MDGAPATLFVGLRPGPRSPVPVRLLPVPIRQPQTRTGVVPLGVRGPARPRLSHLQRPNKSRGQEAQRRAHLPCPTTLRRPLRDAENQAALPNPGSRRPSSLGAHEVIDIGSFALTAHPHALGRQVTSTCRVERTARHHTGRIAHHPTEIRQSSTPHIEVDPLIRQKPVSFSVAGELVGQPVHTPHEPNTRHSAILADDPDLFNQRPALGSTKTIGTPPGSTGSSSMPPARAFTFTA